MRRVRRDIVKIFNFKIPAHADMKVIENAMRQRGIRITNDNKAKFRKLISLGSLTVQEEFFEVITKNREDLLLHGFKMERVEEDD